MSPTNRTSKSQIVHALRMMWFRSRERSEAMKRTKYCCEKCGVKASTAKDHPQKIEVHHKNGIKDRDKIIEAIREQLFCPSDDLQVLCPTCHDKTK